MRLTEKRWILPGFLLLFLVLTPDFQGDSEVLVADAQDLLDCAAEGVWVGCREAGVYAPFQVLVALLFRIANLPNSVILSLLAHLSVVYFALTLRLVYQTLQVRTVIGAWLALFLLCTGAVLTYARSSFGEMGAAFLTIGFLSACLLKKGNRELGLYLALAGMTKDTALAFLLPLGMSCYFCSPVKDRYRLKSRAISTVIACLAAGTVVAGYNYFRFGTVYNAAYLIPEFLVTDPVIQANFFAAIWLSPSGGVAWYWPTFFLFLLAITTTRMNMLGRGSSHAPFGVVVTILAVLTFGFSKWYAPLGWSSWGPRLIMPWLPGALMMLVYFYPRETERIARGLTSGRGRSFAGFATLMAISLPQFLYLFNPQVWMDCFRVAKDFTLIDPTAGTTIQESPANYFAAQLSALWKFEVVPAILYRTPIKLWQGAVAALYLTQAWLIWKEIKAGSESIRPLHE